MRHNKVSKRFSRTSSHLRAMLANMTNDLLVHERIRTTTPKAKLLRRYAERMITLGKKGTLSARRRAFAFMRNKAAVTKLFGEIAPRFTARNGGYTRVLKVGERPGDNAPMSIIELVGGPGEEVPAKKTKKARAKPAAKKKPAAEAKPAAKKAAKPAAKEEKPKAKSTAKKAAPKAEAKGTKPAAAKKTAPKPKAKPAPKKKKEGE
jgi:large subunit ribosomal protein L17